MMRIIKAFKKLIILLYSLSILGANSVAQEKENLPELGDASSSAISTNTEHILGRLWLAQMRRGFPQINDAIKTYLNITPGSRYRHDKIPTLNKSHQLNLDRLDMILHEKKFYNKWKEQFAEDLNLNKIISQNIKKFNKTEWNEKVLFKYGLHLDYYFKKISSDF